MRNGEAIPSKSPIQSRENTERSDFAVVEFWCRGWRPRQPDIEAAKLGIFTNEKKQTML